MDHSRFDIATRALARRGSRRAALLGGGMGLGAAALGLRQGAAQDATPDASPVAEDEGAVAFMFVQTFGSGSLAPKEGEDGLLTLTADHLAGQTIYFSDRPERIVGLVPTERFLGTGGSGPADGLGFTPADPPNAALVFASAAGDDAPGDVLVVELIDPTYDPATGAATYDVRVLADYAAVDVNLVQQPLAAAEAAREFEAASLFIDDCPDGTPYCIDGVGYIVGDFGSMGFCYDWGGACCHPCSHHDQSYWSELCNAQFPACSGNCTGYGSEALSCYEYASNIP